MDSHLKQEYFSSTSEETMEIGVIIGSLLKPPCIIALEGTLGAGKTVLTRGIARAMGVNEWITSPSYTIINEYEAEAFPFYHIDTYRLSGNEDFFLAGGEEMLYGKGICVIEWPEKIIIPAPAIWVKIEIMVDFKRHITVELPS